MFFRKTKRQIAQFEEKLQSTLWPVIPCTVRNTVKQNGLPQVHFSVVITCLPLLNSTKDGCFVTADIHVQHGTHAHFRPHAEHHETVTMSCTIETNMPHSGTLLHVGYSCSHTHFYSNCYEHLIMVFIQQQKRTSQTNLLHVQNAKRCVYQVVNSCSPYTEQ